MVFEAELCIKLSLNWLYLCTSEIKVFKVFTILRILDILSQNCYTITLSISTHSHHPPLGTYLWTLSIVKWATGSCTVYGACNVWSSRLQN